MRFVRTIALLAVGILWLGCGPLVLLAAGLSLLHPRVRAWLRPTRRVVLSWTLVVAALAGIVVVVPAGWGPIPPGPGDWVTPSYVGRPVVDRPALGPGGESPRVTTRSYGTGACSDLVVDADRRLIALCGGDDPELRLIDPDSLRTRERTELPGSGCPGRLAVAAEGVVVASGRRVLAVDTADLAITSSLDLAGHVDDGDCVTGLGVDGADRVWVATASGIVGVGAPADDAEVRTLDLGDRLDRPLAVADDGVYLAGTEALHRVGLASGRPHEAWSSRYDAGGTRGSAPVVLAGGLVAVADNRSPRLQVVVHRAGSGAVVCRAEVFGDDAGAVDGGLVAAGDGAIVTNAHGYAGPLSVALGRTTSRGIARVASDCTVSWTVGMDAPSGAPAVSVDDGLVYAWTKRHSWLGVDAWYLSALELRTGHLLWARRAGLTPLVDNHGGSVLLGPGRAAYLSVLGGLVRIADRD